MDVRFIKIPVLVLLVFSFMTCVSSGFSGYSYAKFRGPVSGPEREVNIVDEDSKYHYNPHHKPAHDYVAKPDYHFAYGVEDPKSMVKQSRQETRLGDAVKGEYSVLDPDGKYRTVKYTADNHNGFQAEIITDGNHYNSAHYPQPAVEDVPQVHVHEVHHDDELNSHEDHTPHEHNYHHHIPQHYPQSPQSHPQYHPIDPHHDYTPQQPQTDEAHTEQPEVHEVVHQEEDTNSYNDEESSEGGTAYEEETEDNSGNESESEENEEGDEYYN